MNTTLDVDSFKTRSLGEGIGKACAYQIPPPAVCDSTPSKCRFPPVSPAQPVRPPQNFQSERPIPYSISRINLLRMVLIHYPPSIKFRYQISGVVTTRISAAHNLFGKQVMLLGNTSNPSIGILVLCEDQTGLVLFTNTSIHLWDLVLTTRIIAALTYRQ